MVGPPLCALQALPAPPVSRPPTQPAACRRRVQGGLGSRAAVEPVTCMLACNAAPGCDSFAFNPAQRKCFLKAGPSRSTCEAAETVCVSARGSPYSCGAWQTYFRNQTAVEERAQPASVQLVEASDSSSP